MKAGDNIVNVHGDARLISFSHGSLERRIEAVLDGIVRAAWQKLCDGAPPVALFRVGMQDGVVLLRGPVLLLQGWVELVEPSLARLLAGASREMVGDEAPVAGAVAMHELHEESVLFDAPRAARGGVGVVAGLGRGEG